MKVNLDFENLEEMIEETLKESLQDRIDEKIGEEIKQYLDENIKEIIRKRVNDILIDFINNYIENTMIKIGNEFSGEEVKEYTIKQYINIELNKKIEKPEITIETRDRWGDKTKEKVDFKKYVLNNISEDFEIEKKLKNITNDVKQEVNNKIKEMFDETIKNNLSETIFNILSSNETYSRITNQIKLISSGN